MNQPRRRRANPAEEDKSEQHPRPDQRSMFGVQPFDKLRVNLQRTDNHLCATKN